MTKNKPILGLENVKAVFVNFFGTLVCDDGESVEKVCKIIFNTGKAADINEIKCYWRKKFSCLFSVSNGSNFLTQRELEIISLEETLLHFNSRENAVKLSEEMFSYWVKPNAFDDTAEFLQKITLPVFIVSNIDTSDIYSAVNYNGFNVNGIFTSEDAECYKPAKEIFELALKKTGFSSSYVIHIGDSLSSDVMGAESIGIRAIWLNRFNRNIPCGVTAVKSLAELIGETNDY